MMYKDESNIKLIITVFLTAIIGFTQAKTTYIPEVEDPLLETWRWTNFPELNGKGTRCIIEDKEKSVWFGVNEGVLKYDGSEWYEYKEAQGFTNEPVNNLFVSENGLIYAATNSAIYVFKNNQWLSILSNVNLKFEIYSINEIPGAGLLCGTDKGIFWIQENKIRFYASSGIELSNTATLSVYPVENNLTVSKQFLVNNIYVENSLNIWLVVGYTNGLSGKIVKAMLTTDKELKFSHFYSEPEDSRYNNGAFLLKSDNGKLYLASNQYDKGILEFSGIKPRTITLGKLFGEDEINSSIQKTKDNSIWVGGLGKIFIYKNNHWNIYRSSDIPIPPSSRVLLYENTDGKLWIAGSQNEVFLFDNSNQNWITYKELNFESETQDGEKWFISVNGKAVLNTDDKWYSYSVEDGLMSAPVRIIVTKVNEVWAAGSHYGTAATAYFVKGRWHRQLHPTLSWNIDFRSILEDSNGSLWFGGNIDIDFEKGHKGGSVFLENPMENKTNFIHYLSGQTEPGSYGLGQDKDGKIWMAGVNTAAFETDKWQMVGGTSSWWDKKKKAIETPNKLAKYSDFMCNDEENNLWVGSRNYGVFLYNGKEWINQTIDDGLQSNSIIYIFPESKDCIWVATDKGISKYDGQSWTNQIFQSKIKILKEGGSIRKSSGGVIWINKSSREWNRRALTGQTNLDKSNFYAIFLKKDTQAPKPFITFYEEQVYQPGNTTISWLGVDPWTRTPADKLQYSYRIDNGDWSPFSYKTSNIFLALDYGNHTFEVRARDLDYNITSQTANVSFNVAPPFYLHPAFYIPIIILSVISIILFLRVIARGKKLQQAKRETDNILFNVQEGLLLLNENLEIGTQYSTILESILEENELANKNLMDIIDGKVTAEVLKNTKDFLELVFSGRHDSDLIEALNPLDEVRFKFENNVIKYLSFRFTPTFNDGINKNEVFVTVKDLTEQIMLSQKLVKTEKEAKKQMELMLTILKVDPSALREYISSTHTELQEIDRSISALNTNSFDTEILNSIFRSAHLIKGNSDLLSLSFFANKAHEFEDNITELKKKEFYNKSDLRLIQSFSNDLKTDLKNLLELLDKIGKIHTQLKKEANTGDNSLIMSFQNLIAKISKEQKKKVTFIHDRFNLNDIPQKEHIMAREVIVQLVRNSIAHGIEPQKERKKLSKDPVAKIELKTFNNNKYFGFSVKDDGRGIQLDKLREKALESKKWSEEEINAWDDQKLLNLIFQSGITTTDKANKVSGRGVGMDLVNEKVHKHNGKINVNFESHKFCEIEVLIPLN